MLTSAPHLYVRRPSPTTVEFTLTTCPPPTVALRVALAALAAVRLAVALAVLFALYTRFVLLAMTPLPLPLPLFFFFFLPTQVADSRVWRWWCDRLLRLHASAAGQAVAALVAPSAVPAWAVLAAGAAMLYAAVLARLHTTESLLVLRGLGIQTASSASAWAWWWRRRPAATRFIPTEKIRDVLINEAFRGFEVRYYLVVVVEGEDDVVVVFPRLLPRRPIVEAVWRGVRGCLYETPGEGGGGGGSNGVKGESG